MTSNITPAEFSNLQRYIEDQSGICLKPEKSYLIENRLGSLMEEYKCANFGEFYELVRSGFKPELKDRLIDAMTTNETLWFRDTHPYTILREKLLPLFAKEIQDGKRDKIRIWSAASSSGQEPYSIAMTARDFSLGAGLKKESIDILGTDISPTVIQAAQSGRYDQVAMNRGLTPEQISRYFWKDGLYSTISPDIRQMVTFRRFNLQDNPTMLSTHFDIVFMRYVAIYFNDAFKRGLYARLARVLRPGGFLVIGAIESLRGLTNDFTMLSHAGGTYYQVNG